jgi:hypothetical protein
MWKEMAAQKTPRPRFEAQELAGLALFFEVVTIHLVGLVMNLP